MKRYLLLGAMVTLVGCGSSDANLPDAPGAPDGAKTDAAPTPDAPKSDLPAPNDASDAVSDLAKADASDTRFADDPLPDVPLYGDTRDNRLADGDGASDAGDAATEGGAGEVAGGLDAGKPDLPSDPRPDLDGPSIVDVDESCACGTRLSWACFCSVEKCDRKLSDFITYADGGKVLKTGQATVFLVDYADCNLVYVQAKTYSDYVPASEYVFDRTTGALVGANVQLDDRQHLCPWSGDARWVFSYVVGNTVPSSCKASECLPGSGSCSGVMD